MLDIFNDDAFSVVELSGTINEMAFVPGRLDELGVFGTGEGISTTAASFEREGDILTLVSPSERGGPGTTVKTDSPRDLVPVNVPHFEINDSVLAEAVQGVRALGTENQLETVQGRVVSKFAKHVNNYAATTEYSRLGAIKGVITYADGSSVDLFNTFGVTAPATLDLDLDNADPQEGALRKKCASIVRNTANSLGGLVWGGLVRALCGDDLFDYVLSHPEVRETFKGWTQAQILREGYIETSGKSYGAFEFGGIVWENYRGQVGNTRFVATDRAHFFPVGVDGLFQTFYAPADYEETVNTVGQRLYARQYAMPNGKGRHLDTQMNELNICTRPKVLLTGTLT